MKKLLYIAIFVLVFLMTPQALSAQQMSGRWVQCTDPATGYLVRCFIPDQVPQQQVNNAPSTYGYPQQQVYSTQPVYVDQINYGNQPVYQTQRSKTVRTMYDVGVSPYSRRPYGSYTRITESTKITVETNAPNYQPNIRVDAYGNSYYWPRYRSW
jgi:hypothetical protein